MTTIEALEKLRDALFDRMSDSRTQLSDEGLVHIVLEGLNGVYEHSGVPIRDLMVEVKKILEWHRTLLSGEYSKRDVDEVLSKVDCELENPTNDAETAIVMRNVIEDIRDFVLNGKLYDPSAGPAVIVNKCDFALKAVRGKCYGNIGKMRRTLWELREFDLLGYVPNCVTLKRPRLHKGFSKINEALAEPVLNCEVFHDYDTAWKEYCRTHRFSRDIKDFVFWLLNEPVDRRRNDYNMRPYRNCDKYADYDKAKAVYESTKPVDGNGKDIPFDRWLYEEAK